MPETPKMEKSPPELIERFATVVERTKGPTTTTRKMFGYPAAFVNGNLATSLFHDSWVVRLPEDRLSEIFSSDEGRPFEPMPGRQMKGFAILPSSIVEDDSQIDAWVGRALAFAATLPPKK